jgi:hypothetical protein
MGIVVKQGNCPDWWRGSATLHPQLLFGFQFEERFERIRQLIKLFGEPRKLLGALIYEVGPRRSYRRAFDLMLKKLQPLSAFVYLPELGGHIIIEEE